MTDNERAARVAWLLKVYAQRIALCDRLLLLARDAYNRDDLPRWERICNTHGRVMMDRAWSYRDTLKAYYGVSVLRAV